MKIIAKTRPNRQDEFCLAVARPPGARFCLNMFVFGAKVTPVAHQLYLVLSPIPYQNASVLGSYWNLAIRIWLITVISAKIIKYKLPHNPATFQ